MGLSGSFSVSDLMEQYLGKHADKYVKNLMQRLKSLGKNYKQSRRMTSVSNPLKDILISKTTITKYLQSKSKSLGIPD